MKYSVNVLKLRGGHYNYLIFMCLLHINKILPKKEQKVTRAFFTNNHFISSFLCVAPYLSLTLSRTHTHCISCISPPTLTSIFSWIEENLCHIASIVCSGPASQTKHFLQTYTCTFFPPSFPWKNARKRKWESQANQQFQINIQSCICSICPGAGWGKNWM